jgi:hypothetical protein
MEKPMNTTLKLGLVGALALSTAGPAFAQYPTPYRPTDQYRQDMRNYENDRAAYETRRADYEAARRDYERRRDDYEAARLAYDRRYGYGAYARVYGPSPNWDEARWADYNRGAGYYGSNASATVYDNPCRDRGNNSAVAGGIIGALAGAALGSNVAARNARTEGAVLGAVLGGAAGVGIGKASAKCDDRGYWFSYNETVPYRESRYDRQMRRSGQYDYSYYTRQRCRLAPAPVDWGDRTEYRYVRVCPDSMGRYRLAG